ncbi:IS630 family transposase, partial [Candidatus Poribacteria bacterium]
KADRELAGFSLKGQLTSNHVELIVPDKQLIRLEYPKIVIPRLRLRGRLFFFDEANVSWCPDTGRIYRIRGEQAKIDSPGRNKTQYILGSLEYPTGSGLYEIHEHKTNVQVRSHWQSLLNEYPDDFLFVVRDNASSHVTPMLDDFLLDNANRLCLVPMPTYSPNLNLIERLWKYMRDNITRNHFYSSFKELSEALVDWLKTLPFERFMSLIGIP